MILKSKCKNKNNKLSVRKPQNNVWRYGDLAYREFILWINAWTVTRKGNRIIIPSCTISKIRQTQKKMDFM